jgi:hypothetical protein
MKPWHPDALVAQRDRRQERARGPRARSIKSAIGGKDRAPEAASLHRRASVPVVVDVRGLRIEATGCLPDRLITNNNFLTLESLPPAQRTAVKLRPHQEAMGAGGDERARGT